MAALICLTLTQGAKAGNAVDAPKAAISPESSPQPRLSEQDVWRRWEQAQAAHKTSAATHLKAGAPTKYNKASGLVGMEVGNQHGEHLGQIKDLIIDWQTEQVSYAVISTGSKTLFDSKEKLLAVPLAALAVSADQKHLILNADKSQVAAATGFDPNHWPSVSNPSWGAEPVWQHDPDR